MNIKKNLVHGIEVSVYTLLTLFVYSLTATFFPGLKENLSVLLIGLAVTGVILGTLLKDIVHKLLGE